MVDLEELRRENTHLRAALANSKDPCVYCQLPAEEMARCKAGFPGCARMDDITGCPEFGAAQNEAALLEEISSGKEREAKLRDLLTQFVAHYPPGVNPFLDGAYRDARTALGSAP